MSRNKIDIDIAEVERLAGLVFTQEEMRLSLGISEGTFYNRKREDAGFSEALLRGRKNLYGLKIESEALTRSRNIVASMSGGDKYAESVLIEFVKDKIEEIASLVGLPKVIECRTELTLPNRSRCDVISWHEDDSISVYEVKCSGDNKGRGWLLYTAIGQLLYYFEVIKDCWAIDDARINLFVISDYDADDYFYRTLKHVNQKITFINLRPMIENKE